MAGCGLLIRGLNIAAGIQLSILLLFCGYVICQAFS